MGQAYGTVMIAQHGQRGDTKIEHKMKGVSGLEVFRDAKTEFF
jgi:hypothetical protein